MGFHDNAVFPEDLSYGTSGGPGFRTDIIRTVSGAEQRVAHWEMPLHTFDCRYTIKTKADLAAVKRFYIARQGAAYGFLFKDPLDNTSNDDGQTAPTNLDQEIGVGDGTTRVFQLIKNYGEGGVIRVRNIQKPKTGTVVIAIDGSGVTPSGNWTVNYITGQVAFATAPAIGEIITAGYDYYVPVRFSEENDRLLATRFEDFDIASLDALVLQEIRGEQPVTDEQFMGGSASVSFNSDLFITVANGRVQSLSPQSGSLKVYLPDTASLPTGAPVFVIFNRSGTYSFDLVTYTGAAVDTLATNSTLQVALLQSTPTTKEWLTY